jgi:hypothetical protein
MAELHKLFGARVAWRIRRKIEIPCRIISFRMGYEKVVYLVGVEGGIGQAWVPSKELTLISAQWPNTRGNEQASNNHALHDIPDLNDPIAPRGGAAGVHPLPAPATDATGDQGRGSGPDAGDVSGRAEQFYLPGGCAVAIQKGEGDGLCDDGAPDVDTERARGMDDGVSDIRTAEVAVLRGQGAGVRQPEGGCAPAPESDTTPQT